MPIFNLIAADCKRLLKDKPLRVVLIINALLALVFFMIMKFVSTLGDEALAEMAVFDVQIGSYLGASMFLSLFDVGNLGFFALIAIAIFIGKEFNYNTIRNKIISGNPRYKIYLSSFATSLIITFIFFVANIIIGLLFWLIFFGEISAGVDIIYSLLLIVPIYIALIAIITFISMSTKSQSLGIIINILALFFLPTIMQLFFFMGNQGVAFVDFLNGVLPYTLPTEILSINSYLSPDILAMIGVEAANGITGELVLRTMLSSVVHLAIFLGLGTVLFHYTDIK